MSTESFVRTSVSIREDLYQRVKAEGTLSDLINQLLAERYKRDHSMFGIDKGQIDTMDLRDHRDRV